MICRTFEISLFSIIRSSKSSLSCLMLMKLRIFANVSLISCWCLISTWKSYLFMNVLRKIACEICWSSSWLWISILTLLNVHIFFSSFAIARKEHSIRLKKTFRCFVFALSLTFWSSTQQKYIVIFLLFLLILKFLIVTTYHWILMKLLTIILISQERRRHDIIDWFDLIDKIRTSCKDIRRHIKWNNIVAENLMKCNEVKCDIFRRCCEDNFSDFLC